MTAAAIALRRGGAAVRAPARARHARRASTRLHVRRTGSPLVLPRAGAGLRLFVLSLGALATAFLLALLYLRFATGIAAGGYGLHELARQRDELRRENALLELQLRRLDTPARIEAEARRLGLQKTKTVLHLAAPALAAGR